MGKQRVEYCFVLPRLLDHVIRFGFEVFHALIGVGHQGYYINLAMKRLFDWRLPTIISHSERYIHSSHPKLVQRYIETLHDYFDDHNILQKVMEAQHYYDADKVEELDELIITGMYYAKDKCQDRLRIPWSKQINKIMTHFHILKIHLSSLCNKIDCSKQIKKKQKLLEKAIMLPITISAAVAALKETRRELQ